MSASPPIESFRDLRVWRKSVDLAVLVYDFTRTFPAPERYCLAQQLRRSTASIPANIAEGFGRRSVRENMQFVSIAMGSLCETESHLELARKLNYLDQQNLDRVLALAGEVSRMLVVMRRSLRKRANSPGTSG